MPDLQLTGTLPTIIANNTVQQALKIRSNLVPPPPSFPLPLLIMTIPATAD